MKPSGALVVIIAVIAVIVIWWKEAETGAEDKYVAPQPQPVKKTAGQTVTVQPQTTSWLGSGGSETPVGQGATDPDDPSTWGEQ
jgi:ABC-type nitrate/sulfonate/bicarbonate transport system permease component